MKQKHLKILEIIFKRPVSGNVKWNDAVSMLKAYGAKIDDSRAGSRVHIALKGNDLLQHRPHPMPTMDKGAVEVYCQKGDSDANYNTMEGVYCENRI